MGYRQHPEQPLRHRFKRPSKLTALLAGYATSCTSGPDMTPSVGDTQKTAIKELQRLGPPPAVWFGECCLFWSLSIFHLPGAGLCVSSEFWEY